MKKIGITTTVPVEVLVAAGYQPVDLNNLLVSDPDPGRPIARAERAGFPLNCCAWIKGLYGVCLEHDIQDVLCVTGGDCSNTTMLMETLRLRDINAMPFTYPPSPDRAAMGETLKKMAADHGTSLYAAEEVRASLAPARKAARTLDGMTWRDNLVSGAENHLWLVSASDFNGDPRKYEADVNGVIEKARSRRPYPSGELRLGYIGVPPVFARDLYPFVEEQGARVVYNEMQRQFAMPGEGGTLADQYTRYTYPYAVSDRLADIAAAIAERRLDGIIHYVQAFCHRGIADIIFREKLRLPVLTLEGNADFFLTAHLKTRLEAFLDMIGRARSRAGRTAAGPQPVTETEDF